LIWCPLSLFGASVWSCCCGGLRPHEYLGQKLALFFEYPHCKHLPVELWTSKTSVETYGTGGKPDNCPPLSDFCLFNPDWPDLLPPVVLAGSEMDGRWPCLPPLQDESVGCFYCCCCYCCCCCCCGLLFSTCVTSEAAALSKTSSKSVKSAAGGCHRSNHVLESVAQACPGNVVEDFFMVR